MNSDGAGMATTVELADQSTDPSIMTGELPTYPTLDKLESGNESTDTANKESESNVSMLGTIFNITCSCLGLGCLFVPSTMCGSGLIVGSLMVAFVGFISHWTGSALVNCTVRAKCKTLSEMVQKVLGLPAKITFDVIMFLLLCGAVGTYVLLMSLFTLEFIIERVGRENTMDKFGDNPRDFTTKWFRPCAIAFAIGPCLVLLFVNNMKVLSYISLAKVGVIVSILFVTAGFAASEYNARAGFVKDYVDSHPEDKDRVMSTKVFPLLPSLYGLMKGISSMICSFLFHIGANDMYFSLKDKSMRKWRKCSLYGVTATVMITLGFAFVGHLSTANQRMYELPYSDENDDNERTNAFQGRMDICTGKQSKIYFQLYNQENMVMKILNIIVIVILVLSYPLYFFFLKNFVLRFWEEVFNANFQSLNKIWKTLISSMIVWTMTLGFALITEDPFNLLDLSTSFLASIAVFIIPTLAWIKMNGGYSYVLTFGFTKYIPWKEDMVSSDHDNHHHQTGEQYATNKDDNNNQRTSRLSVIMGAMVLLISILFLASGAVTSTLNFALSKDIQTNDNYPWRIKGMDFKGSMRKPFKTGL